MSDKNTMYNVYLNSLRMMENREAPSIAAPVDESAFINNIDAYHYIVSYGKRSKSSTREAIALAVIVCAPNANVASKTADFQKMIDTVTRDKRMVGIRKELGDCTDNVVVIISNVDVKSAKTTEDGGRSGLSTHVNKRVAVMNDDSRIVEVHNYALFKTNLPHHVASFPHSIVGPDEMKLVEKYLLMSADNFPKILVNDPQIVWLGARPGQVVRIDRASDTAGIAVAYRVVVANDAIRLPTAD
jgi:DNA-directed RNA polymerase subunit H (RpoH/RPB5)